MTDVFSSLVTQLTKDKPTKQSIVDDTHFVYDNPSSLLSAAVVAKREFNARIGKTRTSLLLAVLHPTSNKVAVFSSVRECCDALGYASADKLMVRVRVGCCPDRGYLFTILDDTTQEITFEALGRQPTIKDRRKQFMHVIATNTQTGEKRLFASPHDAALGLRVTRRHIELMLLGSHKSPQTVHWELKPATMQAIHQYFPDYVPSAYKNPVVTTDDYRELCTAPYKEDWGVSVRKNQYVHFIQPTWMEVKRKLGLIP